MKEEKEYILWLNDGICLISKDRSRCEAEITKWAFLKNKTFKWRIEETPLNMLK